MIVEMKIVKSLPNEWFGCTSFTRKGKANIKISAVKNKDIGTFAMTLLHEMLHVWVTILKGNGAEIDLRKDHKFIYAVENSIGRLSKKLLKGE